MSVVNQVKKEKSSHNVGPTDLLNRLKSWCQNTAAKRMVPDYYIFKSSVFVDIAKQLPKTKEELLEIKGVGEKKVESYGMEILRIVNGDINESSFNKNQQIHGTDPNSQSDGILSVGDLTRRIKSLLESDKKLNDIFVRGEVSNLTCHSSGHAYFSLKDKESQVKCVMFRRVVESLKFRLEHGMKIIIRGNLEVYSPRGEYSIIVGEAQPDGLGSLNLAFIQLKEKLGKEGLFSAEHKKALPRFPKTIGIITSPTGAALQDILNIIKRRYPLVKVLIIPTLVQGKSAASSIVESIKSMNNLEVDSIILGRGGGSLEDLWCFNEEIVARAIFNSKIPIISAVGHETDFTIADFVSDYRAPTPSAAAEKIVPDIKEIREGLAGLQVRNVQAIKYLVESLRADLVQISNRPLFKRPYDKIHAYYKDLDYIAYRLQTIMSKNMGAKRKELEIVESRISALDPKSILKRGYGLVMRDSKVIKDFSDIKINDNIDIILHKGKLNVEVKRIEKKK